MGVTMKLLRSLPRNASLAMLMLAFASLIFGAYYGWAQLWGNDRAKFVAITTKGCLGGYDAIGGEKSGKLSQAKVELYCRCFANGMADRGATLDLYFKDKDKAFMKALIRKVATDCSEEAEGASPKKAPPTKEN